MCFLYSLLFCSVLVLHAYEATSYSLLLTYYTLPFCATQHYVYQHLHFPYTGDMFIFPFLFLSLLAVRLPLSLKLAHFCHFWSRILYSSLHHLRYTLSFSRILAKSQTSSKIRFVFHYHYIFIIFNLLMFLPCLHFQMYAVPILSNVCLFFPHFQVSYYLASIHNSA
jgi:hypothetical protein